MSNLGIIGIHTYIYIYIYKYKYVDNIENNMPLNSIVKN